MKTLAAAVLLLAIAAPAAAQQGATADLTGRVTAAGQPLAGVVVTVKSEALPASRGGTTGSNGGYLFARLPPADYVVTFQHPGFTAAEKRVHLSLGDVIRANADLQPGPLREEIAVESGRGTPAAETISTDIPASLLRELPGTFDLTSAVALSADANTLGNRGGLVLAGAPSWDSVYLVDGAPANEYLSGQPQSVVLQDAIREIAVMTGAIGPEYGRFTGGVVSVLTKSGGNEFSGSLRDTITNAAWTARSPWQGQPASASHVDHAPEATAGGYLLRDRLWFFTAGRNADDVASRFTALTNVPYASPSHDRRTEVKLTAGVSGAQSAVVSYSDAMLSDANAIATRGGRVLDLGALVEHRWQPTRLLAITDHALFAAAIATEVEYSQKRYALRGNGGRSADRIAGTLIVARGAYLNAPFGCGICGDDERDSRSLAVRTTSYRNTPHGNHTLSAGVEGFDERRMNAGTRSSSGFNIQASSAVVNHSNAYPYFGPSTLISWTPHDPNDRGSRLDTVSAWAGDRWDVNGRLTLTAGLRIDRNRDRDAVGRLISNDAALGPRLGGTIDVRGDGRQSLFASAGRYAAQMLEGGGSSQQVGVFDQYAWSYGGPPINAPSSPPNQFLPASAALAQLFAWFDSVGGIANRQYLSFITTPESTSIFHGPLRSPVVDERSIGYAVHSDRGFLRADVMARDWHHFYAARVDRTTGQQLDPFGNTIDVAWVVNDDSGTVRTYRAIQLQGSWRDRSLEAGGGYTWSKLRGNDDEEEGTVTAPRNLPLALWYPEVLGYPQRRPFGYLQQDQRHRARLWIVRHAGRLTLSFLQRFESGHPYSAVADIDPKSFVPNPGYAFTQVAVGPYYFSGRGAYRTDNVLSTDAAVQYEKPVHGARMFVKVDVLNLFGNAAVVAPGTDVLDQFRNGAPFLGFNPFTTKPVEGVNYRLGPTFGKATGPESYQQPRTFQFSFGARF